VSSSDSERQRDAYAPEWRQRRPQGFPAHPVVPPREQTYLLVAYDDQGREVWARAERGHSPMGCIAQIDGARATGGLDVAEVPLSDVEHRPASGQTVAAIRAILERVFTNEHASRQLALETIEQLLGDE